MIAGVLIGLAFAERVLKLVLLLLFFRRPTPHRTGTGTIVILQPILSGDPTLWDCLAANLRTRSSYHRRFIWLVDETDRVGLDGCRALIESYPAADIELVVTPTAPLDVNPKTFKLIEGLRHAADADFIAVLDDDTMLPNDAFETCIPALDEAGLAFGLPYYRHFGDLWSALVSVFVNTNALLTYVPYTFLAQPFTINGMYYITKRDVLQALGNFDGLEATVTDDYAVAQRFARAGHKLAQTPIRHGISTHVEGPRAYLRLMTRWFIFPQASIMRTASAYQQAVFYGFIVLPQFVPLLIVFAGGWVALAYYGVNALLSILIDRAYLGKPTPLWGYALMPVVHVLVPLHILWALLSPKRITWRGQVMRIDRDGTFRREG